MKEHSCDEKCLAKARRAYASGKCCQYWGKPWLDTDGADRSFVVFCPFKPEFKIQYDEQFNPLRVMHRIERVCQHHANQSHYANSDISNFKKTPLK